ncbi:efflux RND transporter periplasmic adaptor subunit [Labilibaculum sp. K2S]|uniref:efflux RND transporter periplasmic adaptor subunit n=1 Tax=Labilibaculum sp. K2S TaxID=3056386 RepID=UPI0025A3BB90|nr:efflux RND transporter periplasmic adaptor subunit [Labilibaculum sp. K2S]MDM8159751.1 efflux RND transporter periplasmic adaptor subunit [Labilibaculum sp. K2S]
MKQYIWISFCLSMLLSACQPSASSNTDHEGHDHSAGAEVHEDHATESLTLFNDQTELFVEFPTLMMGHASQFLTHFTNLESYKPYTEGKLTVSLIKGGKVVRQTVEAPAREGIFTPNVQAKEAGVYTLVFDIESKYGKEQFSAKNIRVYKDHEEAELAETTEATEGINFLKEQAWKIDFATSEAKLSPFQQIIKTTGILLPSVNMEKQIVAKSNGIIHFQSQDLVPGKTIKKNDPIFNLSGNGLAGNNISTQFTEAKTSLEKAKSAFERAKTLHEDQIISEKDFVEAKSNFENATVNFENINKDYNSNGFLISSPVNGFICDVYVNEGQYVKKGDVLAKVDQGSKLLLKADVYQKHLQQLKHIKSANFKLPYSEQIFDTEKLNGRLIAYGKDIHEDDYTTPLYFELDLTPELYAGSFVEVYLKSERSSNVLHIEKSAVLEDQGLKYVFVQLSGESFEKRFVTIGISNGQEVEIISGLKVGERVVSKGAYFVKLASMAGALPAHTHEH